MYHKTDFQEETRATARVAPTDGDAKDLIRRFRFQYSSRVNPHRNGERLCGSRQRLCSSRALLCGSLWFPAVIVWFSVVPGSVCAGPGARLCGPRRVSFDYLLKIVWKSKDNCIIPARKDQIEQRIEKERRS